MSSRRVSHRISQRTLVFGALLAGALCAALLPAPAAASVTGTATVSVAFGPHPDGGRVLPPWGGLSVDLWSDPPAGTVVPFGGRAWLSFATNADCYLALIGVDTEGRIRLIYPGLFDDGWVQGGRVYGGPHWSGSAPLLFEGPPGIEYVYAIASLYPLRHRYPEWLATGAPVYDDWEDGPYESGWVAGDPFYAIRSFCDELVPYPAEYDTYSTAYVFFNVGRSVPYPRTVCADCHGFAAVDPYGPPCAAVQMRIGNIRCSGRLDFRVVFEPCYRYEVWTGWRPHDWHGRRDEHWSGPGGRRVWSSRDGHREIRRHFQDAALVGGGGKGDLRVPDNRPSHTVRIDGGRGQGPGPRRGEESGPAPDRPRDGDRGVNGNPRDGDRSGRDNGPWRRAWEERFQRVLPSRNQPGAPPSRPEAGPDRSGRPDRGQRPPEVRPSQPPSQPQAPPPRPPQEVRPQRPPQRAPQPPATQVRPQTPPTRSPREVRPQTPPTRSPREVRPPAPPRRPDQEKKQDGPANSRTEEPRNEGSGTSPRGRSPHGLR